MLWCDKSGQNAWKKTKLLMFFRIEFQKKRPQFSVLKVDETSGEVFFFHLCWTLVLFKSLFEKVRG